MVTAYLLLNVKTGIESRLADRLKKMAEVKDVNIVYGEYDLIVKVFVPTMTKLQEFVLGIRKDNEINGSSTLISTSSK